MASITWFPGHMRKALTALKAVIKNVDLVLEVRDARVPISAVNPELQGLLKLKRHIVVLTKTDLVPAKQHKACLQHLQQDGLRVMSASCKSAAGVQQVMRSALDWLKAERAASDLSIMMVVGLPNSAKSSLINAFKVAAKRQGVLSGEQAYHKTARVGLTPGLTRQVAGFQVSAEPCVYMLDTPGIMMPAVPSDEVGFRLALAGSIKDSVVGEEAIVQYLLQYLGRTLPASLAAIKASGPAGRRSGLQQRTSSPRHSGRPHGGSVHEQELNSMRACLYSVLSTVHAAPASDEPWGDAVENQASDAWRHGGRPPRVLTPDDSSWHPSSSGHAWNLNAAAQDGPGLALHRYEVLLQCLGVAGARNPSKQQGALIRLLRAFREGSLGKFLLDVEVG